MLYPKIRDVLSGVSCLLYFDFFLLELSKIFNRTNHLAGVAVLVVVPANNLNLEGVVINLSNHCLSCIEE